MTPTICDPFLTITAAAFLAFAVFVGGLGALWIVEVIRARRTSRMQILHPKLPRRP